MAEIIFHIRLVIGQFATPSQRIGLSTINYSLVVLKYVFNPVDVLAVVYVGNFSFVNEEGVNSYTAGHIVPVAHYIFLRSTHSKGTTLHEYQARAGLNVLWLGYKVSALVFVVIIPAGSSRLLRFLFKDTAVFARSECTDS